MWDALSTYMRFTFVFCGTKIDPMNEPKRITDLRKQIIKKLPRFPSDRESKRVLDAKSLGLLLIDYTNWAVRFVVPRMRNVLVDGTLKNDPRWQNNETRIAELINSIKEGADLTEYLSDLPRTKGFTPAASKFSDPSDKKDDQKWSDKDLVLNVMGFHHLHLAAYPDRSSEILFAKFDRATCKIVGIFDHSVFYLSTSKAGFTAERERLFKLFNVHIAEGVSENSMSIGASITTSGHSTALVGISANYDKFVQREDPNLDVPEYVERLYANAGRSMPARPKLKWNLRGLDLGVVDKNGVFFVLKCGLN